MSAVNEVNTAAGSEDSIKRLRTAKLLVWIRRILSVFVLVSMTMVFWGVGTMFSALSKLQFDLFFTGGTVTLGILLFTVLFGRVYCSTLCPLGTSQDIASRLRGKRKYSFKKPSFIRLIVILLTIGLFIAGTPALTGFVSPYSVYMRGTMNWFNAMFGYVSEITAPILKRFDIYSSYVVSGAELMPIFVLFAVFAAAFFRGRLFCNTLCPVGAIFSCLSRYALFRPRIGDKCVACGKCASACKAECIDISNKHIDASRCVMCGNCAASCSFGAVNFSQKIKDSTERRGFLKSIGAMAFFGALPMASKALLPFMPSSANNAVPAIPAGTMAWGRLKRHCIGCHVCVQRCPSKVLVPAKDSFGVSGLLKPVLDFNKSFCQYDCVECGKVCPTKAILPLSPDEKHKVQIGKVSYDKDLCIVFTKNEHCGACAEHCPTGAIQMSGEPLRPVLNEKFCVGCGACEYICPVRPLRSITVKPLAVHQSAEIMPTDGSVIKQDEGFKF